MTRLQPIAKVLIALMSLAVLAGCPKPPEKALTEAEDAVADARSKRECAEEKFRAAQRLLEEAKELSKKKEYDAAERKAKAAKKLAKEAKTEAEANWEDCMEPDEPETVEQDTKDDKERTERRERVPQAELKTVYFEYDSSDLSDRARSKLQQNHKWLQQNAGRDLVLEGHTDSRGSVEYNLALGERRAKSVKNYLIQLGASSDRLRVLSYGEEKPAAFGESPSAWRKNRRVEFVPE